MFGVTPKRNLKSPKLRVVQFGSNDGLFVEKALGKYEPK